MRLQVYLTGGRSRWHIRLCTTAELPRRNQLLERSSFTKRREEIRRRLPVNRHPSLKKTTTGACIRPDANSKRRKYRAGDKTHSFRRDGHVKKKIQNERIERASRSRIHKVKREERFFPRNRKKDHNNAGGEKLECKPLHASVCAQRVIEEEEEDGSKKACGEISPRLLSAHGKNKTKQMREGTNDGDRAASTPSSRLHTRRPDAT